MIGPARLLGLWEVDGDLPTSQALPLAWEALAELCAEQDVLPTGNKARALLATRQEAIHAALVLDVPAANVLALAERYGLGDGRIFLAAAVDVRHIWERDADPIGEVAA